jgi:hypothetical protein
VTTKRDKKSFFDAFILSISRIFVNKMTDLGKGLVVMNDFACRLDAERL